METLTWQLTYATFVAQMFLFAIPVIGAFWFLIKEVILLPAPSKKRSKRKKQDKKSLLSAPEKELQPINCPNCAAGVPLNETSMNCPHCHTVFPVPPEYEEIRQARHIAIEKIKQAQKYWRVASVLTSNWMQGMVIFLTLWLTVCLILILSWVDTPRIVPFEQFIETYQIPVITLIFWIATLGFIAISISLKFKSDLPKIERIEASAKAETAQCKNCGGAISFDAGQFGSMCGYCGVDTYRVKVARKAVHAEGKAAEKASDRLSVEMKNFAEAVEEFLALPTLLISGVIILVVCWGILAIGMMVVLTAAVWTIGYLIIGLAYYPIPTIAGIIVLAALIFFRKRLVKAIRDCLKR